MEFKLFGGNFQLWKLHTLSDYLWFASFLAAGFLFFWNWNRRIKNGRNDAAAKKRVMKKLARLGGRRCRVLDAAGLGLPAGADALFFTRSGVFVVRCVGWGTRVYGSVKGDSWRVRDNNEERFIPNPLRELKAPTDAAARRLAAAGLAEIPVLPLTVFADPFQNPALYLEYGACSVSFGDLKSWFRSLADSGCDAAKAADAFERPAQ